MLTEIIINISVTVNSNVGKRMHATVKLVNKFN